MNITNLNDLTWSLVESPGDVEVAELRRQLAAYNIEAAAMDEEQWLGAFARGHDGELAGGAVGRVWGQVLDVRFLWVHETLRNQDLATRLLNMLETAARRRGCWVAFTDTFSYQAPEFYLRLGYEPFGVIEGFPRGITKHFLRKELGRRNYERERHE